MVYIPFHSEASEIDVAAVMNMRTQLIHFIPTIIIIIHVDPCILWLHKFTYTHIYYTYVWRRRTPLTYTHTIAGNVNAGDISWFKCREARSSAFTYRIFFPYSDESVFRRAVSFEIKMRKFIDDVRKAFRVSGTTFDEIRLGSYQRMCRKVWNANDKTDKEQSIWAVCGAIRKRDTNYRYGQHTVILLFHLRHDTSEYAFN